MSTVLDGKSLITEEIIARNLGVRADDRSEAFETARAELALILNATQQQISRDAPPAEIIRFLMARLEAMRGRVRADVWTALTAIIHAHPILDYFLQDPLTRWSFEKPRGYAGDAQLLDYIYCDPHIAEDVEQASETGKALYSYTQNVPSCVAARERRDLLAR